MRVAIIGGGLIGGERIEAIKRLNVETGAVEIACVVDPNEAARMRIAHQYGVPIAVDVVEALADRPDWVFVCTPHDTAPDIAIRALESGANVLIEKPIGRTLSECDAIIASRPASSRLNVGFNFRFFPGIEAAITDARSGLFGELISVNITLGHGNSPGMENSWKLDPVRCGGGCLIDPGVHVLDLVLLLARGEVSVDAGRTWQGFWNTGIEEEAHVLFCDAAQTVFAVDVSLNRWRSTFRLEINGVEGYAVVEGRGRSYGPQIYRRGRRWGWQSGRSQGESEELVVDKDSGAGSFMRETALVLGLSDELPRQSLWPCGHEEAHRVMELLGRVQRKIQ